MGFVLETPFLFIENLRPPYDTGLTAISLTRLCEVIGAMILYVVGGSCFIKTKGYLIIGSEDVDRLGVDFFIAGAQLTCAVITEKISVKDFLYSLSRVKLSPPRHLISLKVLSKAVVATADGIEFGDCFPVKYTSVDDLKRHFEEYWS